MIVTGCDPYPPKKKAWQKFGELIGASVIEYADLGKGENYKITLKTGETFSLIASGNQYDGGFVNVRFPEEA